MDSLETSNLLLVEHVKTNLSISDDLDDGKIASYINAANTAVLTEVDLRSNIPDLKNTKWWNFAREISMIHFTMNYDLTERHITERYDILNKQYRAKINILINSIKKNERISYWE